MHACWIDRYKAATRASTFECVVASVKSVAGAASSRFLFAGPPDEVPATLESTVSAAINDTNRMMASDEWTWNSAGNVTATSTFSSAILGACETLPALPVEIGPAGNDSLFVPILIAFLFGALFIMNQFLLRRQNRREHPDCKTSDVGSEEAELTPLTASDSYPSITLDPSCLAAPNNAEDKNSEANENPKETPIQEERPTTTMDPCSTTAQVSPDVNQQKMEDHKSNSTTPSGCSMVEDKDKKLAAKPVNSSSRPPKGPTKKVVAQEAKPGLDIAVLPMKKGLSQEANKDIVEPQESPMKEGLEEKSKPSKDIEKIPNSPTKKRSAAIISTSSNDTGKSPTRPSKKFRLSPSVQEGMAKCMKAWLKKDATNGPSEEGDKQIKSAAVAGAQKDNSQDSISTPISKRALKANANKSATLDGRAKKEQLDHPTQRGNASVATSHITQAQVEGVTKKKSARSTSKEGAKKLSKASTATQKAGLGGYAAPDAADGNVLDSGLAGVDGALASRARVHDEYHARLALVDLAANSDNYYVLRLALVDLAANSDKYYVLQLLVDEKPPKKKRSDKKKGGGPDYYLFTRWGRTGTGGQAKLDGPFDDEDEAKAAFKKIFKSKTGAAWGDAEPGSEPRKGKYAHLATAGSGGSANAQWYNREVEESITENAPIKASAASVAAQSKQTHVAPVSPRTERATSGLGLRDKPSSDKALKIGRKQSAATKLQQKQTTTKAEGLNRPKNKRNETSKTTVSETVATTSPDESNDEVVYMATYNPHSPTRQWDINDDSGSGGSSPPPASYSDENDLSSEDAALQGAIYESTQAASPPRAAKNPPHNWLRTASLQDSGSDCDKAEGRDFHPSFN